MLPNLKKKSIVRYLNGAFIGGVGLEFDPLNIPSLVSGYMMNYTTDVPPGSIVPANPQWQDAKILSAVSKYVQAPGNITTQLINGFNCAVLTAVNTRMQNVPFDVFDNTFQDFSILIGFKKNAAIANYNMILAQNNSAEDERLYIGFTPADLFQVQLANAAGANAINCFSVNTYDDQQPHALIAIFDQTNKTCRMVIHTGEDITGTNAAYVAKNLQGNSQGDFRLGDWNFAPSFTAQPGAYGDVMIFSSVFNDSTINALLKYECDRLGIVHVPI